VKINILMGVSSSKIKSDIIIYNLKQENKNLEGKIEQFTNLISTFESKDQTIREKCMT
jgi:hypothetical protein